MQGRPILFSAPMVNAILAGSKTMTRRVCKPQPDAVAPYGSPIWLEVTTGKKKIECPYGKVGDQLWVRESWRVLNTIDKYPPRDLHMGEPIQYEAGGTNLDGFEKLYDMGKLRPSIFMPRWASRINLEITGVRVEQLNDISEEDAKAEGAMPFGYSWMDNKNPSQAIDVGGNHRNGFYGLWESINGAGSWNANPWVWVIEFKRL